MREVDSGFRVRSVNLTILGLSRTGLGLCGERLILGLGFDSSGLYGVRVTMILGLSRKGLGSCGFREAD